MSQDQKIGAAWVALFFLLLIVAFSVSLAVLAIQNAFAIDPNDTQSELLFPWKIVQFFLELGAGINIAFGSVIAIVAAGTGWFTEVFARKWQMAAIVVICLVGLTAIIVAMVELRGGGIGAFRFHSGIFNDLGEAEATAKAWSSFRAFGVEIIAAIAFFLASRLGVARAPDNGALRKLLKKWFGEGGEKA